MIVEEIDNECNWEWKLEEIELETVGADAGEGEEGGAEAAKEKELSSLISPSLFVLINNHDSTAITRAQNANESESDDLSVGSTSAETHVSALFHALQDDQKYTTADWASWDGDEGPVVFGLISETAGGGDIPPEHEDSASRARGAGRVGDHHFLQHVSWMMKYHELKMFELEHGHADVPQGYQENHSLGDWVHNWRRKMLQWESSEKSDEALNEKMVLLKQIGLSSYIGKGKCKTGRAVSYQNAQRWEEQFSALCRYKEENGDCDVPARANGKWKSLGLWVRSQRKAYFKFQVQGTQEAYAENKNLNSRFEKLKRIGFKFIVGCGKGKRKSASQEIKYLEK